MRLFLSLLLPVLLFLSFRATGAGIERSDTLDIRKTIIKFNITDFGTKNIIGETTLDIRSKLNGVSSLLFDLEGLTVDSVFFNNSPAIYSHSGFTLQVTAPQSMNLNDTALLRVHYHGVPIADPAWGGFSFVGNYGFQMGVGFNAQPHSFGRTWHPCFDNFVERSSYEFFITTTGDKMGVCNGWLLDSTINANSTKTWHWKLEEEIPSYLASVAVCQYVWVKQVLTGINGPCEAWIACEAVDTAKVNGSFAHLQQSFSMLEDRFGAHSFPKVGYTLVPFNAGAMEHATNIHIGRPFIDGSLTYETLIAHELTHHWWGDLVTCRTAGEMWLNEGFASYGELLHEEYTYGESAYREAAATNHYNVLAKAHLDDDGYKAVSPMDSLHTYGPTVYLKGADMIHTLRSYLGDSLFFDGLTAFLNAHKFQDISSTELRDWLGNHTGTDLQPFFANWIFDKGFPHFSIDSMQVLPGAGEWEARVFVRQRKHQNNQYFSKVPLEIGFYGQSMDRQVHRFVFDGQCMEFRVKLPFDPLMTVLDPDGRISDAITEETRVLKTTGIHNMARAKCRTIVKSLVNAADSSLIRVEHHWVRPDRFKAPQNFPGYVLNNARYWKVYGVNLSNMNGLLHFAFDAGPNNSYLDSTWIKNTDDSIRLFYRKDATVDWQFANDSLRAGAPSDRIGNIYVKEIKAGEYCFGILRSQYTDPLSNDAPAGGCGVVLQAAGIAPNSDFHLRPNPAAEVVFIDGPAQHAFAELIDLSGRRILRQSTLNSRFPLQGVPEGLYVFVLLDAKGNTLHREKLLIHAR